MSEVTIGENDSVETALKLATESITKSRASNAREKKPPGGAKQPAKDSK